MNDQAYIDKLNRFNNSRHWKEAAKFIEEEIPLDARVLDYGCGTGALSEVLAFSSSERKVVGVDVGLRFLTRPRKMAPNLEFEETREYGWKRNYYDAIVLCSVFDHLGVAEEEVLRSLDWSSVKYHQSQLFVMNPSLAWKRLHMVSNLLKGYKDDSTLYKVWSVEGARKRIESITGFRLRVVKGVGDSLFGVHESYVLMFRR